MSTKRFERTLVNDWLERFEEDGGIGTAFEDRSDVGSPVDLARQRAIEIYQEKENGKLLSERHAELIKLGRETNKLQRTANVIQLLILSVLLLTLLIAVSTCSSS